jgi:hypothetical protein
MVVRESALVQMQVAENNSTRLFQALNDGRVPVRYDFL